MGDDRGKVETGNEHLLHLVPGLPHFTSVYSLEGERIEDYLAPRDLSRVRLDSEKGNLRAGIHAVNHFPEGNRRT